MGECFFWYRLTWLVRTKGRKTVVVVVLVVCCCVADLLTVAHIDTHCVP